MLEQENDCRDLVLPAGAHVQVAYGVDRTRLRAAGRAGRPPEFALLLRPEGANTDVELLRDRVGLDGEPWRRRTIPLGAYGTQNVRMCVQIDGGTPGAPSPSPRFAYWTQPWIATDSAQAPGAEDGDGDDDAGTEGVQRFQLPRVALLDVARRGVRRELGDDLEAFRSDAFRSHVPPPRVRASAT